MQDYFLWNGMDCRQYGIHVSEQPPITIPAERSTQTNVPGRPGSLTQLEGEDVYDDMILTATCFIRSGKISISMVKPSHSMMEPSITTRLSKTP